MDKRTCSRSASSAARSVRFARAARCARTTWTPPFESCARCALTGTCALLLRGTEGEPVADPRRTPQMDAYLHGQHQRVQEAQAGPLAALPQLPTAIDAASTAFWIRSVLDGAQPVPAPIALQVEHILRMAGQMSTEPAHDAHHLPTPPAPH